MINFKEYKTKWEQMDESILKEYVVTFEDANIDDKKIENIPITVSARSVKEAVIEAGTKEFDLNKEQSVSLKSEVKSA